MMDVASRILDYALAGLGGHGKPVGLTAHDAPARPLDKDTLPAVAVFAIDLEEEEADHDGVIEERLAWAVECRAKEAGTRTARQNLDKVVTWVRAWIRRNRKMGGLAMDTTLVSRDGRKAVQWAAPKDIGESYAAARVLCFTTYHTNATDPEESES